ncbi:hypothetical protein FKM82_019978 [Ascaphus truei]
MRPTPHRGFHFFSPPPPPPIPLFTFGLKEAFIFSSNFIKANNIPFNLYKPIVQFLLLHMVSLHITHLEVDALRAMLVSTVCLPAPCPRYIVT